MDDDLEHADDQLDDDLDDDADDAEEGPKRRIRPSSDDGADYHGGPLAGRHEPSSRPFQRRADGQPIWRAHEAIPGACYLRMDDVDGQSIYLWAADLRQWLRQLSRGLKARAAEQDRVLRRGEARRHPA